MDETAAADPASRDAFFAKVARGEIALDGVMSKLTRQLIARHQANGVDMTLAWACAPTTWECPACGRAKEHITRLNQKTQLMCRLVVHHDHMKDLLNRAFQQECYRQKCLTANEQAKGFAARGSRLVSAFDDVFICDDCNRADGIAKMQVGTHRSFSYSPQEIRQFVVPRPSNDHAIDLEVARHIWEAHGETFARRLTTVQKIARVAVENRHWYQELPQNQTADVLYEQAKYLAYKHLGETSALQELTAQKSQATKEHPARWRQIVRPKPDPKPSIQDIEYVAKVTSATFWNAVAADWHCSVCRRPKREIIRQSKRKDWFFLLRAPEFHTNASAGGRGGDCSIIASVLP